METRAGIRVRVEQAGEAPRERRFDEAFTVGRDPECGLQVDAGIVSRQHARVFLEAGSWWIEDLGSSNGTYHGEQRVERLRLGADTAVRLGRDGPVLRFDTGRAHERVAHAHRGASAMPAGAEGDPSVSRYVRRYFAAGETDEPAGEHTQMIRRAYEVVHTKQKRRYTRIIAAVSVLLGIALAALGYQLFEGSTIKAFYALRELDLKIVSLQAQLESAGSAGDSTSIRQAIDELAEQRADQVEAYEGKVRELGRLRPFQDDQERVIYRMAYLFNESQNEIPAEFVAAVKDTIRNYWRDGPGRGRLERALRRAEAYAYTGRIVRTMQDYGLPPQFFYLALIESGFDSTAISPVGARGMWQFMPETGTRYDLRPGTLERQFDVGDDRHRVDLATVAAARYLRDIYTQLAHASWLLTMASYNWGEHRVLPRLDAMGIPDDARSRSYWQFFKQNWMPEETKKYVLLIFSAAVIGEDPALFGFDFENPLERHLAPRARGRS